MNVPNTQRELLETQKVQDQPVQEKVDPGDKEDLISEIQSMLDSKPINEQPVQEPVTVTTVTGQNTTSVEPSTSNLGSNAALQLKVSFDQNLNSSAISV